MVVAVVDIGGMVMPYEAMVVIHVLAEGNKVMDVFLAWIVVAVDLVGLVMILITEGALPEDKVADLVVVVDLVGCVIPHVGGVNTSTAADLVLISGL